SSTKTTDTVRDARCSAAVASVVWARVTSGTSFSNPAAAARVCNVACWRPTILDANVTAACPAQLLESALEHCSGDLPFRIVFGKRHQHADPPHPVGLLCLRRERPRRCCAADCGQQFPPSDGDCHTPLPCEVRKWNDTTPRARCP